MIINIIGGKNNFNNSHEIALAPQVEIASFVRIFTIIKFHFFIIFGKEMKKVYLISHCCNFCCILGNRTLEGISSNGTETNPH